MAGWVALVAAGAEEFGRVACGSFGIRHGTPMSSGAPAPRGVDHFNVCPLGIPLVL